VIPKKARELFDINPGIRWWCWRTKSRHRDSAEVDAGHLMARCSARAALRKARAAVNAVETRT
jgi:bifunctional DNA-binding transcriptional regulator/antitoxin component of YhaV-PrlF toxin-antitoxin module